MCHVIPICAMLSPYVPCYPHMCHVIPICAMLSPYVPCYPHMCHEIAGSPYRVNVQQPFTFRGDFVREFGGLERPWGIACAPSGHIVAVDNTGWKGVHVFDSSGGVLCSFMDAMRSVNVWGPEGMCYYPTGVTVDKEGNILVVDGGMNRIQKFTESGTLLKVVGSAGNGSLQFNSPTGIRVNTAGEVYVCDRKNHRVHAGARR